MLKKGPIFSNLEGCDCCRMEKTGKTMKIVKFDEEKKRINHLVLFLSLLFMSLVV